MLPPRLQMTRPCGVALRSTQKHGSRLFTEVLHYCFAKITHKTHCHHLTVVKLTASSNSPTICYQLLIIADVRSVFTSCEHMPADAFDSHCVDNVDNVLQQTIPGFNQMLFEFL